MHDIKGRKIEKGDFVVVHSYAHSQKVVAKVYGVNPKTETCNISVSLPDAVGVMSFNASESEIVLKHDGEKPSET